MKVKYVMLVLSLILFGIGLGFYDSEYANLSNLIIASIGAIGIIISIVYFRSNKDKWYNKLLMLFPFVIPFLIN